MNILSDFFAIFFLCFRFIGRIVSLFKAISEVFKPIVSAVAANFS